MLNSFYFNFLIYLDGFQFSAAFAAGYWEILRKTNFYHFMPIHLQANKWKALK